MDINKVWLSGVVVTEPQLSEISGSTPICAFSMQVNEKFTNRHDQVHLKPNIIRVEALGRAAKKAMDTVVHGKRYHIEGYLRQDFLEGDEQYRVRVFAVIPDESLDQIQYKEGLKKALGIVKNSVDRESAIEKLKKILDV
jgi:single-stranded DNA-binding protein